MARIRAVAAAVVVAVITACGAAAAAEEDVSVGVGVVEPIPEFGSPVPDEPTGEEARRVLPTYETYDPDTGLYDAVPSDAAGELD